jgi:eukaryotic-like serine/threonine-protein kinase
MPDKTGGAVFLSQVRRPALKSTQSISHVSTSPRQSRSKRKIPLWRSDAIMGLAIVLAVFALHAATDFFSGLERRFYDLASTQTSRLPSDRIAVIAIDDALPTSVAGPGRAKCMRN